MIDRFNQVRLAMLFDPFYDVDSMRMHARWSYEHNTWVWMDRWSCRRKAQ